MSLVETDLTGAQIRAARGLLNISIAELSARTGVSINTIRRAEALNGPVGITRANARLLRSAFENADVILLDAGELGSGARLAKPDEGYALGLRRRLRAE